MRCTWFSNLATNPRDPGDTPSSFATSNEVEKAKILLWHVAKTYLPEVSGSSSAPKDTESSATSQKPQGSLSRQPSLLSKALAFKPQDDNNDIVTQPTPQAMLDSEIDRWHKFEGGKGNEDAPLMWWKENGSLFPILSRLARDYLAIPATSVSVERTFSKSRHICSDLRSSMKAETITEALLCKTWIRSGLFYIEKKEKSKKNGGSLA